MSTRRRDLLKMLAVGTGAAVVTPILTGNVRATQENVKAPAVPWPYQRLNPELAGERGYAGFYRGACCYGAFDAIISQLRETVGFPYTVMPSEMMVFGEGGVAGISSLCGALNGASAATFLVAGGIDKKQREAAFPIIHEVFNWYEQEALPSYRPKSPKFEIKASAAHSPLCHVSVSRWCKETGFKSFSKERSERCAWLTGSVAKYTVELLNSRLDGRFKPAHALSAEVQACRSCHDQGGSLENSRGMMDCGGCHFTGKPKHP